jgi:S1-C subfamily serine protease
MINRLMEIAGGAVLMGALALGSQAPQAAVRVQDASQQAQDRCAQWNERIAAARDRMHLAMEQASWRAHLATARATARAECALAAAQIFFAASQKVTAEAASQIYAAVDGPGWLGVRIDEVTPEKAKELKLSAERGALVTAVEDDSPAAKAGLKVGDVITEFDGQRVEGTAALRRMVREVPPGRTVAVTIWRDGQAQSLNVVLSGVRGPRRQAGHPRVYSYDIPDGDEGMRDFTIEIPDIPALPEVAPLPSIPDIHIGPIGAFRAFGAPMLGVDAEDLSGQLGSYFGAPDGEGVLIREVMPGTPAEKAGLKAGDVITKVDGKRVRTVEDLRMKLRDRMEQLDRSETREQGDKDQKVAPAGVSLSLLRKGVEMTLRVELQQPARRMRMGRRVFV